MPDLESDAPTVKKPRPSLRRRLMLLAGVMFIVGVPVYIELTFRRPIGSGPAGPSVDAAEFDAPWTERSIKLVGIGDSITRGLGAKNTSHTFFQRLRTNPPDEYQDMVGKSLSSVLPNLSAENFAVSGSTSLDHADVIANQLPTHSGDTFGLVVMTTGGNDLIHSYGRRPPAEGAMYGATTEQAESWIKSFRTRLETMMVGITEKFPAGCEIFLADIYDPTDGVGDAPSIFLPPWPDGLDIHAKYNDVIREVADRHDHVHVVGLHQTFLGHGSHCRQFWRSNYDADDPHYWFYSNIEDPNDRGYDAIRRVFLNAIVQQRSRLTSMHQRVVD
ncbi:GDSL-like Lipase/Acylhydrolase [Rubripirellula lacrimiformis]|uniref:GDSL-like Lipase/Acylhydrolase n=1 Tax=Rubripirellula lacrimiformis TaxID=1930273 RepID=A0A517N6M5_9BACT|nr:SGNH/GDSL hydrolase family protein [Rubripirellula lacrimiformis]QDT02796.1 GDSL-like Lipase/Acylhydrolase [Rubripirellula lacrimiformis]